MQKGQFRIARDAFAACLSEHEQLATEGYTDLRYEIAVTRTNYGLCLWSLGDFALARRTYEDHLNRVSKHLIAEGRSELRPYLARTRMNFMGACLV